VPLDTHFDVEQTMVRIHQTSIDVSGTGVRDECLGPNNIVEVVDFPRNFCKNWIGAPEASAFLPENGAMDRWVIVTRGTQFEPLFLKGANQVILS
jgi:hypothetical protein